MTTNRSRLRFHSFRACLTVFFVGLLLAVQVAAFVAVDIANTRIARRQINEDLVVGARVFARLIENRSGQLIQAARLLSGDFAFKTAFASGDPSTLVSALRNHRARIEADVMLLYSLDETPIANTLERPAGAPPLDLTDLFEAADDSDDGEAAAITIIDDRPYQIVMVPLLAPLPVAWIGRFST